MDKVDISVIIPTFNRIASLLKTLSSLDKQNFSWKYEVIIVDDWSTDDTKSLVSKFKPINYEIVYLYQNNYKQARARNNWAKEAKWDLLIFLQDDIWPEPWLISTHYKFHSDNTDQKYVSIWKTQWTKELRNDDFHKFLDWTSNSILPSPLFSYSKLKNWENVSFCYFYTNNIAIKKGFFQANLFNEEFNSYGWEDIELWFRLEKQWMIMIYLESALASHNHKYSFNSFLKREKMVAKWEKKLIKLQPELERFFKKWIFKKIVFTLFTHDIALKTFWILNKNFYWYFSWKRIKNKYN